MGKQHDPAGTDVRATESGIPVERVYGPGSVEGLDPRERLGEPGSFPYTRGVHPTMYRERPWTMRQYAGFATAEETNERFRYLLAAGAPGLSTAFDLPTQLGMDSDDPLAAGEVGRVGVAIDSVEDMGRLFAGIPLGEVSTSMTINAPAAIVQWVLMAEEGEYAVADHVHAGGWWVGSFAPEASPQLAAGQMEIDAHGGPRTVRDASGVVSASLSARSNYAYLDGHARTLEFRSVYRSDTANAFDPRVSF